MGNRIDRPSYSDVVAKHRREREKNKKVLTPEEEAALIAEEEAFVPAGAPQSSAATYLANKDRKKAGLSEVKPPEEVTKEEIDFMQGKQKPIEPKEPEPEEEFDFFSTMSKGVGSVEKKTPPNTNPPRPKSPPLPKMERAERPDNSDLEAKLDKAADLYNNAQSQIDKREAIEAFFNGLGKIGAGMAGRATGTDMSGTKFDKQDWEKKRDRTSREFDANRADIRQQGRDREQSFQFDTRAAQADQQFTEGARANREGETLRAETLAESIRHNKEMELLGQGKLRADIAKAAASASSKTIERVQKQSKEVRESIQSIAEKVAAEKLTEEEGRAGIQHVLVEQLGIPPEQVDKLMQEPGMLWGTNPKSLDAITTTITPLIFANLMKQNRAQAAQEGHTPVYRIVDGRTEWAQVPTNRLDELPPEWTIDK